VKSVSEEKENSFMNNLEVMDKDNKLQEFSKEEFGQIRTVILNGDPWFIAKDICTILEIGNPSQAVARLESFERNTIILNEGIGNPNKAIVSESGFYALVLSSRKQIAKPFRLWVTKDVLPSIRKTGMYKAESNKMETMLTDMGMELQTAYVRLDNIEKLMETQTEEMKSVIDNMTISTRQQEKIHKAAKDRVNNLLGGAHSEKYKRLGRTCLTNLWSNFKSELHCGSSYKDLNPKDYDKALDFINNWNYTEN
jgi:prophage antirepressor-like protein